MTGAVTAGAQVVDNTCNKRFAWKLGELPIGYDHKYTYSHLGYNLKPLDPQAAIGRVQLKRLPEFIEARKQNWESLRQGLAIFDDVLEFALPTHAINWSSEKGFSWDESGCRTNCSWFGFKIAVRGNTSFSRTELAEELDRNRIGNRMLFGGNLLRQPAFVKLRPRQTKLIEDNRKYERIRQNNDQYFIYRDLSRSNKKNDSRRDKDHLKFYYIKETLMENG